MFRQIPALDLAARTSRDAERGQASLFEGATSGSPTLVPKLPPIPAPSTREMLAWERETLGIFVSGHPLAELAPALKRTGATPMISILCRARRRGVQGVVVTLATGKLTLPTPPPTSMLTSTEVRLPRAQPWAFHALK